MTANSGVDEHDEGFHYWHEIARSELESGILASRIERELFDHTWAISAAAIRRILELRPGLQLLEAGSGWGRLIHALKFHEPSLQIDGYELTPELAAQSRVLLQKSGLDTGVSVTQADLVQAELPQQRYDAFYSSRVLHYIDDKARVLRKLHAALKPGGRGLVILPNIHCPYRVLTYKHASLFPIEGIGEIMTEVGFQNLKFGGFGFFPPVLRFSHRSVLCRLDRIFSATPLARFAGLAYVVGEKA